MTRRAGTIYAALAVAWTILVAWQVAEHRRVRQSERVALVNRSKDISTTLGLVLQSQRRFGGVISQERLESALNALVTPGELDAIYLLNDTGDVLVSAGSSPDVKPGTALPKGVHWGRHSVTLLNLVDLGTNVTAEMEGPQPTIVLPRDQLFPPFGTNRPPRSPSGDRPPSPDPRSAGPPNAPPAGEVDADPPTNRPPRMRGWRGPDGRPPFGRPFWMSEAEYKAALEKKGVHSFLLVLSTESLGAAVRQDLWLRALVSLLAIAAAAAVGVAWRNLGRSADLEVRLVRAAELNTRLKEMNLAAAGLAHETRNPLNIIRGLAQMIARKDDASPELRGHCRDMIDEADRLTAQLNEFINYSRPREVRRSTVSLQTVVGEVVRALASDLEDKAVRLEVAPDLPAVEADEQLLRQALFNLLLNAIQAVDRAGEIHVRAARPAPDDIQIDIQDNGPGVLPEHRTEIFKPYFTTHAEGTGLGLAVVQQIVLAHGWDILCLPHAPRGTILRIRHIRPAPAPR